jgi:hypothetical protein
MKVWNNFIILHDKVDLVFVTKGPRSHFFGYYDKSPFNGDGRHLLCHSVDFDGRMVQTNDQAEIGFWDLTDGSYTRVTETKAFNWQQGSMLQWLPGSNYKKIIFNERSKANFISVILNLNSGNKDFLPTTIYSLTPDGRYALTPRFERLYYCRPGYCYPGIEQPQWNYNLPPGDGIVRMNLQDGTIEVIVETSSLVENNRLPSIENATHYVEHIIINPDGNHCVFLHRWVSKSKSIVTRLYSCKLDGSKICLFPDSGMYSHGTWINPDQFVIWGRKLGAYSKIRRSNLPLKYLLAPVLGFYRRHAYNPVVEKIKRRITTDAFLLFSKAKSNDPVIVGEGILKEDGHPSMCPNRPELLLVDTYEDSRNYRHLLLYNTETGARVELGRFFSPPQFNRSVFRCDLHPRWNRTGNMVCVDSVNKGYRQMLVLDLGEVLREIGGM